MSKSFLLLIMLLMISIQCSKTPDPVAAATIDPTKNADLLGKALIIPGATNKVGTAPASSTSSSAPVISNSQSGASVASNTKIFIPFSFTSTANIAGMYLLVNLSGNYWDVILNTGLNSGQIVLPVGIPANVLKGTFSMTYCIYTTTGLVSQPVTLFVNIVDLNTSCLGTLSESGSDGITVRSYQFAKSGTVNVSYNMYSAPDRMDIFVDGVWVSGTGSTLSSGQTPPASNCSSAANGFISGTGTKVVSYTAGKRIDIYMSGCFGGTAWDYTLSCP